MKNPQLKLTLFKIRSERAVGRLVHTANVYSELGMLPMEAVLRDHLRNMQKHKDRGYLTFATYDRNHTKQDITSMTAIMLEYPYRHRVELDETLERMPWAYYRIDSIDEHDGPEARILVAFPLAQPITKTDQYTRAASLLWDEIGIGVKSTGAHSATFLFAPYLPNPTVSFHDKDRAFLDAAQYVTSNRGNWVMVERDESPKPAVEITDDGLWEMPVRGN